MSTASSNTKPLRGALSAMPLLVLNLGCEMLFILEQRLRAQNISAEKSVRVLGDVCVCMFTHTFLFALFRPQEAYTPRATRQIFDRLAHSSIMRLNKTSMDKLYDLMCMGVKLGVLSVRAPTHMMAFTLNHLDNVRRIVDTRPVAELIQAAAQMVIDTYSPMSMGEWFALKHTLLRFFQDRRVKVSLFLSDGLQGPDGTIFLDMAGPLPFGTEPPGTLRIMDPITGARLGTERLPRLVMPNVTPTLSEPNQLLPETRPTRLGENMYAKERKGASGAAASAADPTSVGSSHSRILSESRADVFLEGKDGETPRDKSAAASAVSSPLAASGSARGDAEMSAHGRAALDLLATLVRGRAHEGKEEESQTFNFTLFHGDAGGFAGAADLDDVSRSGGGGGGGGSWAGDVITFDAADAERTTAMMRRLGLEDSKTDAGGMDDDLLSLMDAAVAGK